MVRFLPPAPCWWQKPILKVARVVTILASGWAKSAELNTVWVGMMAGANPRLITKAGPAPAAGGLSMWWRWRFLDNLVVNARLHCHRPMHALLHQHRGLQPVKEGSSSPPPVLCATEERVWETRCSEVPCTVGTDLCIPKPCSQRSQPQHTSTHFIPARRPLQPERLQRD